MSEVTATNTYDAEEHYGEPAMTVRKDTATALGTADGKFGPFITDASGRLWVRVGLLTPGTGASDLGKAEDAAHASGDTGVMLLAVRRDAGGALAGTDGDYIPPITDANGRLWVTQGDDTSTVYNGTTALTPKFAIIDAATSGNNTLVAAVASKKIRVLAAFLVAAGTVTARFESGADGTALTGQMTLATNIGFTLPYNPVGWFETVAATLLNLELSAAVSVDGSLVFVEV